MATHLATAIVLFLVFLEDWKRILRGMWRSLAEREIRDDNPEARLGWLLVIGTVPAGVIGLLAEDALRGVFASAASASFFLMLNGVMLYGAERLRRRAPGPEAGDPDKRIAAEMSWAGSIGVGAAQALALIPGFSRSGASMGGGLLVGLSTRTPPASRSCWRRRSSAPRPCSSCPSCSAPRATACAGRRWSPRSARR